MNDLELRELIEDNLGKLFAVSIVDATVDQLYKAIATSVNDILRRRRRKYNERVRQANGKRVYYLSMEFLMGRSLKNNLFNLGLTDQVSLLLSSVGISMEQIYACEPDAGLGNGGLGRLAAAYLDGLASNDYPAMGFSICYEYGLFKQHIVDGWQTEAPDVWLPGGSVWLAERPDKLVQVKFDGKVDIAYENGKKVYHHTGYNIIEGLPCDMMVSGYNSSAVSVLRLWRSQSPKSLDFESFAHGDYQKAMQDKLEAEILSKVLYPSDNHSEGKTLRLKQQYFLVSSSIQSIVNDHIRYFKDIHTLPRHVTIHINDTHPTMCIPELLNILIDRFGLGWDEAWGMVCKTINYTNHTILAEALEKWPEDLIMRRLPRIYVALKEINQHFFNECHARGFSEEDWSKVAIIYNGEVRMANLCVLASSHVNGVSALHSNIIKDNLFNNFYKIMPEKFTNVTNGITYRRWLCQSNPGLSDLIESKIGPEFKKDPTKLKDFLAYKDDDEVLNQIGEIKYRNKCAFAKYVYNQFGIVINPNSRFDVQAKRLHEYKRQLLNVLKIVYYFCELEKNPTIDFTPQTFIFAAKAAGSYFVAKQVIELIWNISKEIDKHPEIREKLNVVFLENYNVTLAEKLMPASEVSEQISLAGKEASGTGNMKFMINGAITFGTLDGANVEISENVGPDNIFIFGMNTEDVANLWKRGYNAIEYYNNNPKIKEVIDHLYLGFNNKSFGHIADYLLHNYPVSDPYMCLADFDSYLAKASELDKAYLDKRKWNQMSLVNTASSGVFAADRSIEEYAKNIWELKKVQ